jgi:L-aminopeptidase/D-esterase-like protein
LRVPVMKSDLFLGDIPGFKVGHAQHVEAITGCSVILAPNGATCGVDQRGGAPGTRETDLCRPMHLISEVHAVLLSGGSAFGLAAADGVMRWLEEHDIGFDTGFARVPLVPTAVLFDLSVGRADIRPDAAMGYNACETAVSETTHPQTGNVGAGIGATVGKVMGPQGAMKGGLGQAVVEFQPGLWVGAMIAVNCFGDVVEPLTGQIIAGARRLPDHDFVDTMGQLPQLATGFATPGNTVIGVVATNATLNKEGANKVAQMAHNGLAKTISPAHTMYDGDTIFTLASGHGGPVDVNLIGAFAVEATALAVVNAIEEAATLAGIVAAADLKDRN